MLQSPKHHNRLKYSYYFSSKLMCFNVSQLIFFKAGANSKNHSYILVLQKIHFEVKKF